MNYVNRRSLGADRAPVRLMELKDEQCRYPVGGEGMETLYCGAPTLRRKSWCARCDRRVHTGRKAAETELIAKLLAPERRP